MGVLELMSEKREYWSDEEYEAIRQFIQTNYVPRLGRDWIYVNNFTYSLMVNYSPGGYTKVRLDIAPLTTWVGREKKVFGLNIRVQYNYCTILTRRVTSKNFRRLFEVMDEAVEKFKDNVEWENKKLEERRQARDEVKKICEDTIGIAIGDDDVVYMGGTSYSISLKIGGMLINLLNGSPYSGDWTINISCDKNEFITILNMLKGLGKVEVA